MSRSQVRFIGYLDRSTELPDCYAAGDAFVFASRTETQGLVLLEAMAQGTPVVSTAELGTRSILTADCGAFVVPEEEETFAAAVAEALDACAGIAAPRAVASARRVLGVAGDGAPAVGVLRESPREVSSLYCKCGRCCPIGTPLPRNGAQTRATVEKTYTFPRTQIPPEKNLGARTCALRVR